MLLSNGQCQLGMFFFKRKRKTPAVLEFFKSHWSGGSFHSLRKFFRCWIMDESSSAAPPSLLCCVFPLFFLLWSIAWWSLAQHIRHGRMTSGLTDWQTVSPFSFVLHQPSMIGASQGFSLCFFSTAVIVVIPDFFCLHVLMCKCTRTFLFPPEVWRSHRSAERFLLRGETCGHRQICQSLSVRTNFRRICETTPNSRVWVRARENPRINGSFSLALQRHLASG